MGQDRHRSTLRILLVCVYVIPLALLATRDAKTESFFRIHNEKGGYRVLMSPDWSLEETVEPNSYFALFRQVDDDGDPTGVSLEIRRLTGWRETLGIQAKKAKKATQEYANLLAEAAAGEGKGVIISANDQYYGMDLYYFYIGGAEDAEYCTLMRMLAGVKGKEWFHALWKAPCVGFQEHVSDLNMMRESLRVETKWTARQR